MAALQESQAEPCDSQRELASDACCTMLVPLIDPRRFCIGDSRLEGSLALALPAKRLDAPVARRQQAARLGGTIPHIHR
jgi:hypothetical protein